MDIYEFDAIIMKHEGIDGAFIEFPYDVEKEFGVKGQVKVWAKFDDCEYRGSLAKMGHNCHFLGMTKEIRNNIGKKPGDKVHVVLKQDNEPRIVELPVDFKNRLNENLEARKLFDSLSYSNQRKYVQWILGAKKVETRNKRLDDSIDMLGKGIKSP